MSHCMQVTAYKGKKNQKFIVYNVTLNITVSKVHSIQCHKIKSSLHYLGKFEVQRIQ